MTKKTLITGGAGFIGSHLAKKLLELGHSVRILDNFSTGKRENIHSEVELIEGDIRDLDTVKKACEGIDFISHHAAQISVPLSIENPEETMEINGLGTLNVLLAAQEAGASKITFASSSAVYGDTENLPITEDEPVKPLSPYAVSKLLGEYYCQTFEELYGLQVTVFRYFNVYGEGQDPDSPYAAAIPKFIRLKKAGKPLTIFGDGLQTRDFVHVSDVAQANITAFETKTDPSPINIGSGETVTVNKLAEMIGGEIDHQEERQGDIKHSSANIEKAKEAIQFNPKKSLKEGVSKLIGETIQTC
ncbi:SDR family oxidoreductase [Patescibacteria group bacterium]|nr:SDR family oxidoreductase [Patescibacteria group bacterium]